MSLISRVPGMDDVVACVDYREKGLSAGSLKIYDNPGIRYQQKKTLLIGNFISNDDRQTANFLFGEADKIARELKASYLVGPVNGSTWNTYRFTTTPGVPHFFGEHVHPDYYPRLFTDNGFTILYRYQTGISHVVGGEVNESLQQKLYAAGVSIRTLDMDRFEEELLAIHELCNREFQDNPLFTPVSFESFLSNYSAITGYIDPRFVWLAERNNRLEGFVFCLPDHGAATKRLIIKTVAKRKTAPDGLITGMVESIYQKSFEAGFTEMIHAYMFEENRSAVLSKRFGGRILKEHAVYVKEVLS